LMTYTPFWRTSTLLACSSSRHGCPRSQFLGPSPKQFAGVKHFLGRCVFASGNF
jgi:hypothetical protein